MLNLTTDPAASATLLAASIATGDLDASCNCLSMGLNLSNSAAGSGLGTSSGSDSGAAKTRKRTSKRLSRSPSTAAPFRTAIGTEEVQLGVDLDSANVIDLGSTLRLPRTRSPSPSRGMGGKISFPYIQSQPPRRQAPEPLPQTLNPNSSQPQRTPRKSFLSKLKKQLSSKGSHPPPPILSVVPSILPSSPSQSATSSPTSKSKSRFTFHLPLPQPLTPLSLSAPTSPLSSPFPSPNQSHANLRPGTAKRESAPASCAVLPGPLSVTTQRKGGLLVPLSPSHFESLPHGDVARKGGKRSEDEDEDEDSKSILSLGDCLESGWEGVSRSGLRESKREMKMKRGVELRICEKEVDVRQPLQEMRPFRAAAVASMEDGDLKRREPEEREATEKLVVDDSDDVNFSNTTKTTVNAKGDAKLDLDLDTTGNDPNATAYTYAPFVPLVFQHERLQQKLKVPLPIVEFQGGMKECEIESVAISPHVPTPFPPRRSSLSASSIRKRTKSAPSSSVPLLNFKVPPLPLPAFPVLLSSSQGHGPQAKKRLSTATSPSTQTYIQGASTSNAKAKTKQPDRQKDNTLKRPDTAPASSTATSDPLHIPSIPFPVIGSLDTNTERETERQRTTSKLSTIKKKIVPERLQPTSSLRSSSSTLVLPIVGSGEEGDEGGSVGDSAAGDGSRLSWHPYARVSVRESPELMFSSQEYAKMIVKRESEEQSDMQPQFHPASRAERPSPPTSPTAFNSSGSGSGSESSTRSPITPMSPLFWATAGTVYERKGAAPSGVGIGLSIKGAQVESQNEKKTSELEMDSDGLCNELLKNEYNLHHVPHPYSRSYTHTTVHFGNNARDRIMPFIQRRPSRPAVPQNGTTGNVSALPPPTGPLPLPPSMEKEVECGRGRDKAEVRNHTQLLTFASGTEGDIPESSIPEEYLQTFSIPPNSSAREDDDSHTVSHPYQMHSHSPTNSHSQSSESYEHDPEYEALLAANTLANAGVLGSIRNIGVGRQLLSAHLEPKGPSSLKVEGKRKRTKSDTQCDAGVGSEWTLYLGNDDDIPPMRQDLLADIGHEPFGLASGSIGKSLEGVRGRTKSESALGPLEFGKTPSIRRSRSSTMAGLAGVNGFTFDTLSSPPPPVPKLPKERQIQRSEDWTLSLPILPPDKGEPVSPSSEGTNLKGSKDLSDPVSIAVASTATLIAGGSNTLGRSISKRHTYPQPEVIVCVEGVEVEDDDEIETDSDSASQATVAGSQSGTPFGLDLNSLELDDDEEDDSLFDISADTTVTGGPGLLPLEHIHFSVPRIVSTGSGIESATWGSEIIDDDAIRKRRRRFSDGLESLMAMAGVSVRMRVDSDGESVCIVDGQSSNGEEGDGDERTEEGETVKATNTKENFARLDALSADLKRFNELLKEGIDATKRRPVLSPVAACSPDTPKKAIDLKQARSCGILPSQTEVKQVPVDPFRVQQIIDGLRNSSPDPVSTMPASSADIKKTLVEYPPSSSGPSNTISSSVPISPTPGPLSNTPAARIRPPLPFAPSSHSLRSAGLGIGPSTCAAHQPNAHGRSTTGRPMSMSIPAVTKPSLPSTTVSNTIPVGVVGSGLKVGGNGRVICLSGSASSPPPAVIGTVIKTITTTNANIEKRAAIVVTPDDDGEGESVGFKPNADMDSKRNSVSSSTSAESFFTSFSTCSQASTPPPSKNNCDFLASDCGSQSDPSTPRATLGYGLTIITTPATNCIANDAGMSPNLLDDVYTPNSSATPTPLASSFPVPPPLPTSFACLGDSLNIVSRMLAAATMADQQESTTSHEYCPPTTMTSSFFRLSSASDVSLATIVPSSEQIIHGSEKSVSYDASGRSESEIDTESLCSGSFYSARSSFDAR